MEIKKRRKDKSSRIFITGGTGFLGSHVAAGLLDKGYSVVLLARSKKGLSAEERVRRLLGWHGVEQAKRRNVQVIEGAVDNPGLGIGPVVLTRLSGEIDEIIHCASETSFSERKRADAEAVNIIGLRNVLDFAAQGRCHFFHHLSTAYVAGKVAGRCPEELPDPPGFFNVYEETKCLGEKTAWVRCRDAGIRLSIYRPSIVYGDSRTGKSLIFNALYYPVKAALFLKSIFERDIKERDGKRAAAMDVRLEEEGFIHLPIRMEVRNGGGLNLVPVDFVTRAFLSLFEEALDGGVFHLVNNRLKRIEDIIDYANRHFRLRGIRAAGTEDFDAKPKNALEMLFDSYLEAYGPYMRDTRVFDTGRSGAILSENGVHCPDFDYEVFARCMDYAVHSDWGSKIFL